MRMLRVELSRARSRRLVLVSSLVGLGAVIAITVGVFATHHDRTAAPFESPAPGITQNAPQGTFVTVVRDKRFHYTDLRESTSGSVGIVASTSELFFAVVVVAGASLVGAEYRFGTLTTLLTWEPRRVRVAVAKVLAALILGAVAYLLLEALLALALVPVAAMRGTFAGADAAFARGLAGEILRGTAIAGGLAALGACLATLGRNTSAALGGLFVYLVAVEGILQANKPELGRWLLVENLAVVLTGGRGVSVHVDRPLTLSGLLLVAYLIVMVGVTAAVFRARDVT